MRTDKDKREAQLAALVLKGLLAGEPPEVQAKVKGAADKIRAIVAEHGDEGIIALTLVTAEKGGE